MVYIRNKRVKGMDYSYLVKSIWDKKKKVSKQETIKYLGRTEKITLDDIPEDINKEYSNEIIKLIFPISEKYENVVIPISVPITPPLTINNPIL